MMLENEDDFDSSLFSRAVFDLFICIMKWKKNEQLLIDVII